MNGGAVKFASGSPFARNSTFVISALLVPAEAPAATGTVAPKVNCVESAGLDSRIVGPDASIGGSAPGSRAAALTARYAFTRPKPKDGS